MGNMETVGNYRNHGQYENRGQLSKSWAIWKPWAIIEIMGNMKTGGYHGLCKKLQDK
jgi:hypothetical protein